MIIPTLATLFGDASDEFRILVIEPKEWNDEPGSPWGQH